MSDPCPSPDPINRTVLVTVRVSAEERELLHQIAKKRGQTLSQMLVSRWLPKRKRPKRSKIAARANAIEAVTTVPPACAQEPSAPARPDATRLGDPCATPSQGSLFDELGGR